MNLNSLPKLAEKDKKRMGRGLGSGKGKTGGRGQKGQKARGKIPLAAVGGGLIFYKKLPFRRGWGNRKSSPKALPVKLSELNKLKRNTVVDLNVLVENKIVGKEALHFGVKILSEGKIDIPLQVKVPVSAKAKALIEKQGGKVV